MVDVCNIYAINLPACFLVGFGPGGQKYDSAGSGCGSGCVARSTCTRSATRTIRINQPEMAMSADKDRGIRRQKQKRAKAKKRQERREGQARQAVPLVTGKAAATKTRMRGMRRRIMGWDKEP